MTTHTEKAREPFDPEFAEWVAAGMPQETLDKWTEKARQLAEDDDV